MTRYKTHLIAVKKFNNKEEEMIMRDIRDAMEYLAIIMSHHDSSNDSGHRSRTQKAKQLGYQSPATHIYCYDAKVIPFPQSHN
jgi:hypothetical protein